MRTRERYTDANKRMLDSFEAAAYIGQGITKTRQLLNEIGAKRTIGRRVVYDKRVIDAWLDSMAAGEEN